MPLAFPWERSNRVPTRHLPGNAPQFPLTRSGRSLDGRVRYTDASSSAAAFGEHIPDLPAVARRKEAELNALIGVCYELYNGHKYINSYGHSDFHEPPDDEFIPPVSPAAPSLESRSHRHGLLPPARRSLSQTSSSYPRLQNTLDQILPSTPQKDRHASPHKALAAPSAEPALWTPPSRDVGFILPKRRGLPRTPLLRGSTSTGFHSPLASPSVPEIPDSPHTPRPLRLSFSHVGAAPSVETVKPTLIWPSSSSESHEKSASRLASQRLDRSTPSPRRDLSEGRVSQRSFIDRDVSSGSVRTHASSETERLMELRKRAARPETPDKAKPRSAGSVQAARRKNPYVDETKLFSRNSRLISRRLHGLFTHPQALEILTKEEREKLSKLLPSEPSFANDEAPSSFFLRHSVDWRTAVREFQEDLDAGRYEAKWLAEALNASLHRRQGDFDSWKDKNFEEFWGQKSTLAVTAPPSPVSEIDLVDMAKQGCFHVGDMWTYSRLISLTEGSESIFVEKELRLTDIKEDGRLLFSVPPGQQKGFAHPLPPLPRKAVPSPRLRDAVSQKVEHNSPVMTLDQAHAEIKKFKSMISREDDSKRESSPADMEDTIFVASDTKTHSSSPAGSQRATSVPPETGEGGTASCKDAVQVLISRPEELESQILDLDGRSGGARSAVLSGNAWKIFRCRHENKDIGSPWDLRQRLAATAKA